MASLKTKVRITDEFEDGESVESAGTRLFEQIVAVASGKQTLSEQQGIGDEEFCPWMPGPIF